MADSAQTAGVLPSQLSFKHTAQRCQSWRAKAPLIIDEEAIDGLLELIAQPRVGNRFGRLEPRAVKRRSKPDARLTMPRANARASIRRYGHPRYGHPNRKAGESLKYVNMAC